MLLKINKKKPPPIANFDARLAHKLIAKIIMLDAASYESESKERERTHSQS